jgi:hypothetical protein
MAVMTDQPSAEAMEWANDVARLLAGRIRGGTGMWQVGIADDSELVELMKPVLERVVSAFAAQRVEQAVARERERIAGWLDCTADCYFVSASGTCQRTNDLCSHHVAESIRAGEAP